MAELQRQAQRRVPGQLARVQGEEQGGGEDDDMKPWLVGMKENEKDKW